MRQHRGMLLSGLIVLLVIGGLAFRSAAPWLYVSAHGAEAEAFACAALAEGTPTPDRCGPWPVSVWREAGVVEFHTRRSTAFGGIEKGFYYSAADAPVSFQATGYSLTLKGGGWSWSDPYGNHGRTGRIAPHWFWFEAVF